MLRMWEGTRLLNWVAAFLLIFLSAFGAEIAQSQTMPEGSIARWDFEGNYDDNSGAFPGTPHGNAQLSAGLFGQALKVSGAPDHVLVTDAPELQLSGSFSISVWVKPLSTGQYSKVMSRRSGNKFIFLGIDGGTPYGGVGDGEYWRTTPRPSGSGCDYVKNAPISLDVFHSLIFT